MARQKIPGLSLAVVRGGRLERAKGYGLANLELGVVASERTVYQSGSLGKQFTAGLVMLLVEEGKLSIDDPIGRLLDGVPPASTRITLCSLMSTAAAIQDHSKMSLLTCRLV